METLWEILEETQSNMDQLSAHHVEQKDFESQKLILQESKELEEECQKVIEMAQSEILKSVATSTAVRPSTGEVDVADKDQTESTNTPGNSTNDVESSINPSESGEIITQNTQVVAQASTVVVNEETEQEQHNEHNESVSTQQNSVTSTESRGTVINHRLKPLKVPDFDGDKRKFEAFWALF